MDQSKSSSEIEQKKVSHIPRPKRSFSTEFWVGLFTIGAVACAGWLSVGLGNLDLNESNKYVMYAEFDNISGLKQGASVEIAGVQIGQVAGTKLKDSSKATVALKLDRQYKIRDDDVLSIRTKGIIGDRYIKVSPGASDIFIEEGKETKETESVVDIEDIIGKIVHSLGSGDKEKEDKEAAK